MEVSAENNPTQSIRRPSLRVTALLVLLMAAMAGVWFSPVRQWLADSGQVKNWMQGLGLWAYPVSILAVAALVGLGTPRLLFCALGGMVFGFGKGLILTQAGTLLGYYAIFLFVRLGGRAFVMHHCPGLKRYSDLIHEQGVWGVILVRQLPIHGTLLNLCLGLSHLRHRHFLVGTLLGLLPEAVPVTLIGAGIVKPSAGESATYIALAVIVFAALALIAGKVLRRLQQRDDSGLLSEELSRSQ